MPLGTKVGVSPGDIVLDGNPAPPKGHSPPIFGPYLLWPNGRPSQLLLSTCLTGNLIENAGIKQLAFSVSDKDWMMIGMVGV